VRKSDGKRGEKRRSRTADRRKVEEKLSGGLETCHDQNTEEIWKGRTSIAAFLGDVLTL
jgi:hypothetical protein